MLILEFHFFKRKWDSFRNTPLRSGFSPLKCLHFDPIDGAAVSLFVLVPTPVLNLLLTTETRLH